MEVRNWLYEDGDLLPLVSGNFKFEKKPSIIYANKNSSGQDLSKVMNHPNRYMSREFCENLSKSESPFIYIDDYISKEFVGGNEYRADQIKQLLTEIEDQNSLMKGRSVYEILKNMDWIL